MDPSSFQTFIVLAVFVSAVLLQGVVQDYKESEKLSSDLECAFRELFVLIEVALFERSSVQKSKQDAFDSSGLYADVETILLSVLLVIEQRHLVFRNILKAVTEAEVNIYQIFQKDLNAKCKKLGKPFDNIRKAIGRLYVIQNTNYIAACYSLMDAMVLIVLTLMATTNWPRQSAAGTAMAFTIIITFLFSYLWLFIRWLEDPFEYPHCYNLKCYAASKRVQMSMWEEILYGGSIDMSNLFVDFGQKLRNLIDRDTEAAAAGQSTPPCSAVWIRVQARAAHISGEPGEESGSDPWASLRRLYLLALSLPWVIAMLGLRFAVWYGAGADGWLDPSVFLSFISLTVFVTALLLQGLIQDYKESERTPSELLSAFQGLEAAVQVVHGGENRAQGVASVWGGSDPSLAAAAQPELSSGSGKEAFEGAVLEVRGAVQGSNGNRVDRGKPASVVGSPAITAKPENVYDAIAAFNNVRMMLLAVVSVLDKDMESDNPADSRFERQSECVREAEKSLVVGFIEAEQFDVITALQRQTETIRQLLGRIQVIANTRYILAGYSLTDSMVAIVLVLMTLTRWSESSQWYLAASYTTVITFLFAYLSHLIRMVEDPFTYPDKYNWCCLKEKRRPETRFSKVFLKNSIDMHILTIDFGYRLFQHLPPLPTSMHQKPTAFEALNLNAAGERGVVQCAPPATLPAFLGCKSGSEAAMLVTNPGSSLRTLRQAQQQGSSDYKLSHCSLPYLARRWRISLWTIPFVAGLVGCRLAVWYGGGVGG